MSEGYTPNQTSEKKQKLSPQDIARVFAGQDTVDKEQLNQLMSENSISPGEVEKARREVEHRVHLISNYLDKHGDNVEVGKFVAKHDAHIDLKKQQEQVDTRNDNHYTKNSAQLFVRNNKHELEVDQPHPVEMLAALRLRCNNGEPIPEHLREPYVQCAVESLTDSLVACRMDSVLIEDIINTFIAQEHATLGDVQGLDELLNDVRSRCYDIAYDMEIQQKTDTTT